MNFFHFFTPELLFYSGISFSTILPLSIDKISYFSEIKSRSIIDNKIGENIFKLSDFNTNNNSIKNFLNNLDNESNYLVNIIFTPDISYQGADIPQMLLSKPIMVNRYSSHTTILTFINHRVEIMSDTYFLSDSILEENIFTPGIIFHYWKLIIF
jgi:hypothetical protein